MYNCIGISPMQGMCSCLSVVIRKSSEKYTRAHINVLILALQVRDACQKEVWSGANVCAARYQRYQKDPVCVSRDVCVSDDNKIAITNGAETCVRTPSGIQERIPVARRIPVADPQTIYGLTISDRLLPIAACTIERVLRPVTRGLRKIWLIADRWSAVL